MILQRLRSASTSSQIEIHSTLKLTASLLNTLATCKLTPASLKSEKSAGPLKSYHEALDAVFLVFGISLPKSRFASEELNNFKFPHLVIDGILQSLIDATSPSTSRAAVFDFLTAIHSVFAANLKNSKKPSDIVEIEHVSCLRLRFTLLIISPDTVSTSPGL